MSKVYRKSLLAMMVAAAVPVIVVAATDDTTIYVTTTADEDSGSSAGTGCSLREAVMAARLNKPYGGCIAGQVDGTDKIKFKKGGEYLLSKPLVIDNAVTITGSDAFSYDDPDAVNNTVPGRTQLNTVIKRDPSVAATYLFPLIDTTFSKSAVTLTSVVLRDGSGVNGGAIHAAGTVTLTRVYILNSKATVSGGAVYLDGPNASFSSTDSIFAGNTVGKPAVGEQAAVPGNGAVLAMSCLDYLTTTKRTIAFDRNSIINNGNSLSKTIINFCGAPGASISASTISNNTVTKDSGSAVIKYIHSADVAPLHPSSSLTIQSNTIVQNTGWTALLYDNVGTLNMGYNVLAFNHGDGSYLGKSCRYWPEGKELKASKAKVSSLYDAIFKETGATSPDRSGECYLTVYDKPEEDKRGTIDLTAMRNKFADFFYRLPDFVYDIPAGADGIKQSALFIASNKNNIGYSDYSTVLTNVTSQNNVLAKYGFLPAYIPKLKVKKEVKNSDGSISDEIVASPILDANGTGCSTFDQRGANRNVRLGDQAKDAGKNRVNLCDSGAVELGKLYAGDILNASNTSVVARITSLEDSIKGYKDGMASPSYDETYRKRDQLSLDSQQRELDALKVIDTGTTITNPLTQRYRQVYASILTTSVERELNTGTDTLANIHYYKFIKPDGTFNAYKEDVNPDGYTVTPYSVGRQPLGYIDSAPRDEQAIIALSQTPQAKYVTCIWNPDLQQIMVSRLEIGVDGKPAAFRTPEGSAEYCAYVLTQHSDPSIKSIGYVQARIVNVTPTAKDDSYTLKYGSTAPITLNLLANDNDDGDGKPTVPGYPSSRSVFYEDKETDSYANIKVSGVRKTDTGFETNLGTITVEYIQPCPNSSTTTQDETCYGGKMTYSSKNIFSPFNDSFKYKVLDADKAESNEATVTITNTATTTDDTRGNSGGSTGSGGGGGGSIGWLALAGLGVLAAARRRLTR